MDRILRYFADNKLLVNIIIIAIVIVGVISILQLKQNMYPTVSLNRIIIRVVYPGAAATDVELNAVVPIERELKTIRGIKKYSSVSTENSAIIFVEIDDTEGDEKEIKDKIYRELSNVEDLADGVDEVKIIDMNPEQMSIYRVGIHPKKGYNVTEKELYDFADDLEEKLLRLDPVSDVGKSGYRDREIKINVLPGKMSNFQISLNDILSSIKVRNVRVTGGTLQSTPEDKTIVTIGEFEDPMDVHEVIVRSNFEQNRVRIEDIANVTDDFKKEDIMVKINGNKGVTLSIEKKSNADVVKTVKIIKNYLKSIEKEIPAGIEISRIEDTSLTVTSLLNVVKSNAVIGFILVFLVLFAFLLDFKTSFWTAFGIPITMLSTFIFMRYVDFSINIVTLAAMITVMGMLVDHGIIISEIIYDYKSKGHSPLDAVVMGVKDVIAPVSVTILTTIVAFIPMFSIKGLMGKFIYAFPTVVIFALIASFLEATFILPNHLMHIKHRKNLLQGNGKRNWFEPVANFYGKALKRVLKFRYIVVVIFVLIFGLTIFLSLDTIKGFVLFDDDSSDQILIQLEAPRGTNLTRTSNNAGEIENIILKKIKDTELISIETTAGHHIVNEFDHQGYHENWALISINLVPKTKRDRTAQDIITDLRTGINTTKIKTFNKILFNKVTMGPPTGSPVDVKIIGNQKDKVQSVKKEIQDYLETINGVFDIDDDEKEGKKEIKFVFDFNKMAQLGIDVATVSQTVRTAYEGVVATSIQTTERSLDFRVMIDNSYQKDKIFLENLLIPSIKYGRLIKLNEIAGFSTQESKQSINHFNGDKVVTVTANIKEGTNTSAIVMNSLKTKFSGIGQKYPGVVLKYAGEAEETQETLQDMIIAFILAIIMIYFVLVLLFKTLGQPLIVMITIPFGVVGAILAFMTHGVQFTFLGVIGIIGLSGVVVNDSVVMVDFINKAFKRLVGKENIINTIADGAKKRLRPVVLTTFTTVAGLLPTAYGIGGYSGMLVPIVLAIAYGLLFASLLTLIFIPSLYLIRLDIINIFKGKNK